MFTFARHHLRPLSLWRLAPALWGRRVSFAMAADVVREEVGTFIANVFGYEVLVYDISPDAFVWRYFGYTQTETGRAHTVTPNRFGFITRSHSRVVVADFARGFASVWRAGLCALGVCLLLAWAARQGF